MDNIIQFLLKIRLILWDKFSCNFKYIFINETCFIKIVVIVGQINKKENFTEWGGALWGPKGQAEDGVRNFFCHAVGQEESKTKPYEAGMKTPSFGLANSRPIAIPMFLYVSQRERERSKLYEFD